MDGFYSRMEERGKNEPTERSNVEITQSEQQKENRLEKKINRAVRTYATTTKDGTVMSLES